MPLGLGRPLLCGLRHRRNFARPGHGRHGSPCTRHAQGPDHYWSAGHCGSLILPDDSRLSFRRWRLHCGAREPRGIAWTDCRGGLAHRLCLDRGSEPHGWHSGRHLGDSGPAALPRGVVPGGHHAHCPGESAGCRESGMLFFLPTYALIVLLLTLIVVGLIRSWPALSI